MIIWTSSFFIPDQWPWSLKLHASEAGWCQKPDARVPRTNSLEARNSTSLRRRHKDESLIIWSCAWAVHASFKWPVTVAMATNSRACLVCPQVQITRRLKDQFVPRMFQDCCTTSTFTCQVKRFWPSLRTSLGTRGGWCLVELLKNWPWPLLSERC